MSSFEHLHRLTDKGVLRVTLGSRSPAKLAAVAAALTLVEESLAAAGEGPFTVELHGVNAASGVADQPWGEAETREFTRLLAGRQHDVFTGHALLLGGAEELVVVRTGVTFRDLTEAEVAWYAATGEGRDKAGGYALQGKGAVLVEGLEGCWSNVVGLSLPTVVLAARRLGVELV